MRTRSISSLTVLFCVLLLTASCAEDWSGCPDGMFPYNGACQHPSPTTCPDGTYYGNGTCNYGGEPAIDGDSDSLWGDIDVPNADGDTSDSDTIDGDEESSELEDNAPEAVLIEAGNFTMGSPSNEPGHDAGELERPITLTSDFYIMHREVLQADFESLMGHNPSLSKESCTGDCPVEFISFYDAIAYANELSLSEGLSACYSISNIQCLDSSEQDDYFTCFEEAHEATYLGTLGRGIFTATVSAIDDSVYDCEGWRLPTEAEWEYAARAGSTEATYNGSVVDDTCAPNLDPIAWYNCNSSLTLRETGKKADNDWDLYDMLGNVHEWVWDSWVETPSSDDTTDPEFVSDAKDHITRGGGFTSMPVKCRAANRTMAPDTSRSESIGFRLVQTAD